MSKLIRLIRALIRKPSLVSAVIHDDRFWQAEFRRRFGHIRPLPQLPLTRFIGDETALDTITFLGGGSLLSDLALLRGLASQSRIRNYFEIGSWRGESLAAVLPCIDAATSLDLGTEDMQQLGWDEQVRRQMGVLVQASEKITWLRGDSMQFDFQQHAQQYDLVFIDGNHTYEYVRHDTKSVYRDLTHPRSVIVWHDYAHDPEQVRWEVYRGILDGLPASEHGHLFHIAHTKCAVLFRDHGMTDAAEVAFPQDVRQTWDVIIKRSAFP